MMKVLLFGDFVKNQSHEISVSDELREFIKKHDRVIINLEGPIVREETNQLVKAGPYVSNSCDVMSFFEQIGVNIMLLANNHIMDYGVPGLKETQKLLEINKIGSVGVGDFTTCYKPLVIGNCSIINACQLEFWGIKEKKDGIGFAWFRHDKVFETILEEKAKGQYCIMIPHAGLENEILPLPEIRKLYKEYINCGADIVVGGHPHIIQGMEYWNGKPIYYSLGNMWFDTISTCDAVEWSRSVFVSIDTETQKCKHGFIKRKIDILDFDNSEKTITDFEHRCRLLYDDANYCAEIDSIVEREWNEYYKKCYLMIPPFSSENVMGNFFNIVRGVLRPRKRVFNETMLLHNIQIEPHRWCVERYLRNKNRKENSGLINEKFGE